MTSPLSPTPPRRASRPGGFTRHRGRPGRQGTRLPARPGLRHRPSLRLWHDGNRHIEWFLEYDFGTEVLAKRAGKLAGYAALAQATGITTPLLVWLPTSRREVATGRMPAGASADTLEEHRHRSPDQGSFHWRACVFSLTLPVPWC
ncbi:replication-relaxation family protein [Saccharothrix carnea]|uniref:replication-relaxation family protein n=1 Tax=Saccharothrix carnea TaxID=1280637 RepID=UPI003CCC3CF7